MRYFIITSLFITSLAFDTYKRVFVSKKMLKIVALYTFITAVMTSDIYFAPSLFLNHGGGPLPVLGEKRNTEIAEGLRNVSSIVNLSELKAIIVVTAHREEEIVTISSGERHSLVYDYNNYPPESYTFKYEAPGE